MKLHTLDDHANCALQTAKQLKLKDFRKFSGKKIYDTLRGIRILIFLLTGFKSRKDIFLFRVDEDIKKLQELCDLVQNDSILSKKMFPYHD